MAWVTVGSTAYPEEEDSIPCLANFSVRKYPMNVHEENPGKSHVDCTQIRHLSNQVLPNTIFKRAPLVSKGATKGKSTEYRENFQAKN